MNIKNQTGESVNETGSNHNYVSNVHKFFSAATNISISRVRSSTLGLVASFLFCSPQRSKLCYWFILKLSTSVFSLICNKY